MVAFEGSLSFDLLQNEHFKKNYINITGPGLLIFELNHEYNKKIEQFKSFKNIGLISTLLLLIGILPYLFEEFKVYLFPQLNNINN